MKNKKLKMGMIGGGPGSFIGAVHRIASRIDNHIHLVAGVFSSDYQKSKQTADELDIEENRVYKNFEIMLEQESLLPINEKMDFVSIVTPNHLHFEPAKQAMECGFHVVLDKPMCLTIEEAKILVKVQAETKKMFCLTHTYTGYPMLKQAKQMIQEHVLGKIRKVYVKYPQAWLSEAIENENQKQAAWRTDPKRSGKGGCIGDIGTHAFNLVEFVTGLEVTHLCTHLETYVAGRLLDDDAMMFLKFNNEATGSLIATQIAAGEENNIQIEVYGEKGGMVWQQIEANSLQLKILNQPIQIFRCGNDYNSPISQYNTRTPAGHPEGYLEAFANIYRNFSLTLLAQKNNFVPNVMSNDFPTIYDGLRGMAFVENAIISHLSEKKWTPFKV